MLRQRRQQAPDSSLTPVPTPATSSEAPAKQAKGKATKNKSKSKSKATSSPSKMQDEPAAELRTLDGDGRDSTDGLTGSYHDALDAETSPLSPASPSSPSPSAVPVKTTWLQRNQWVALALASGACAAFNGVFAKLTTTELTTNLSKGVARLIGLDSAESAVEVVVRGTFFALNLVFNGVMWTLFTRALARGHSATQVSIMNTSANFVLTALLGLAIFSESLPPLWWVGAAMLVAGNVIIGRKDEGKANAEAATSAEGIAATAGAATTTASADAATHDEGGRRRSSRRLAAQRGGPTSGTSSTAPPGGQYKDEESSDDEDFAQI
ncbi:hypothetical protein Sste5346_000157 [Sporothrix stenoceras]|uniref:Transmembrane protein 42 n=1 Tax=Sporothrix stenoceras TaxID=5173 RepID=A0ABR3ZYA7_9PEZI